jgi:S-DNA-T family DNA segregation ATPase FtsK/SpoIIIE
MNEFTGVVLFACALIWFIALATYRPSDPVWFFNDAGTGEVENFAGRFGAFIALASLQVVGYSSYVLPFVLGVIGWHYFWCRAVDAGYTKLVGAGLFVTCLAGLMALAWSAFAPADGDGAAWGGWIGSTAASVLRAFFNRTGAAICLLTLLVLAVIMSTQFSFGRAAAAIGKRVRTAPGLVDRWSEWKEQRQRERQRQQVIEKHVKRAGKERAPEIATRAAESAERLKAARARGAADDVAHQNDEDDEDDEIEERSRPARQSIRGAQAKGPVAQPLPLADASPARTPAERRQDGYLAPPVTLFDAPKDHRKIDERELMDAARLLEEKSREFSVEGSVVQIHPGPVVTTYEFKPDAGVKYSRITGLADDLCLAMQAESVLIDRIPGKSTVGIQIPNRHREPITLRELLESDTYQHSTSKLSMALGKGIHGDPIVGDLATMPHLLIAGSTGAGKSVSVNAMLSSVLFRATPEDVRLILIDPKRLELGMYEGIPHLLTPVVVDPKQAANALRWAVREMEERYKSLAKIGVRNIEQYNRNVRGMLGEQPDAKAPDGSELRTLPFVIVVIDELADLMMVAGKEVEESIARLAQMARAVGIHLILATQRPSVDVITGVIKANLPARIAFRVTTRIDSRTILDGNGAEQLLGKGDMLLLPPSSSRYVRIHGPYISEQETARLCSFLRKQGKPTYDTTITAEDKAGPEKVEMEKDDLYDEAARIVVSTGQASISYLQRRLRIGFSRAARLIDMMELEGVVSPAAGGKREVLVDQGYFEEVDAQLR